MYYESQVRIQSMDLGPGPMWSITWLWPHGPIDDGAPAERVDGAEIGACLSEMAVRVEAWRASQRKKVEADRG